MLIKFLNGTEREVANLCDADLRNADLRNARLRNADLRNADLRNADLRNADLRNADLRGADLRYADLSGADLRNAHLTGAHLTGAHLTGAQGLEMFCILPDGDLIGYKKLANGTIATLHIPADAKRINAYGARKCRAEFAVVIRGTGAAQYDETFMYAPGATVRPREPFCDDPRVECASGIHFFITEQEARDY